MKKIVEDQVLFTVLFLFFSLALPGQVRINEILELKSGKIFQYRGQFYDIEKVPNVRYIVPDIYISGVWVFRERYDLPKRVNRRQFRKNFRYFIKNVPLGTFSTKIT